MRKSRPAQLVLQAVGSYSANQPFHGYQLSRDLNIQRGTIYPLLRRMENEGLIRSGKWDTTTSPPRRLYYLTAKGRRAAAELSREC